MDSVNTIHNNAEVEAINSQLPGRQDGPADAYRHILGAAEAVRQGYPDVVVRGYGIYSEAWAYVFEEPNAARKEMDLHNNDIGIQIGKTSSSWDEVLRKAREAVSNGKTLTPDTDKASWVPRRDWGGNPKNDATTNPNDRLPTTQTNWPPRWPPSGDSPSDPKWWKDFPFPGTFPQACTPADLNGNGIPDYMEDIKKKVTTASKTKSPIALDLNGDGITTTGLQDGAYFDHDGNGFAENTGWVNSEDGILVRDLDGNKTIDTGRELFGSETLLANGQKAANGYQALAELDTNQDGQINQQDAAFAALRIWKDANGDGYSSADELFTLVDAGVQSIAIGYTNVNQTDANGNTTQQTGTFTRTDGSTGASADIWFNVDKTNTIATDWLPETATVSALPDLQGYGNVRDLHQAILRDSTGHLQDLVQQFNNSTDPAARHELTIQLIYAWAGVENIDPASRSARLIYGNVIGDARKLATLEAILGEPYLGTWCWGERDPNPHGPASKILLQAFNELADSIYSQLMAQTHFKPLLDSIGVTWDTVTNQFDFDISNTIAALQVLYVADPDNSILAISEFADTLKLSGDGGLQVVDALRVQGDLGGNGFARLLGGIGLSTMVGDAGNNTLHGSSADDVMYGMAGQDNLYGNGGNDLLSGGTGGDYLVGDAGNDTYLFGHGDGQDIIFDVDATVGNTDTIW